jgi:2-haloalkanoic acid dehalogenase type II
MAKRAASRRRPPYEAVSFAGFGTLVDRDRGLARAVAQITGISDPARLKAFQDAFEPAEAAEIAELEEFHGYGGLLDAALRRAGAEAGLELDEEALSRMGASVADWPLYDDAARALPRLAERFRLGAATQLDGETARTLLQPLAVPFDVVVGADRVGCFKPEPDHLMALVHELELDEDQLLHVAADPDLDLFPAAGLGIPTVFLDRFGMELPEEVEPVWRIASLDELVERLLPERRS